MAKHTQGRWTARKDSSQMNFEETTVCSLGYVEHGKEYEKWFVSSTASKHGDQEATAKLIAAAPDLLEALKLVRMLHLDNECNYPEGTIGHGLNKKIEAAIKKATE